MFSLILVFTVELKGGLYHNMFLFPFFIIFVGFRLYFNIYSHIHCLIMLLGSEIWVCKAILCVMTLKVT